LAISLSRSHAGDEDPVEVAISSTMPGFAAGCWLINALAENPPDRKLSGVFLIAAPFVGAGGWPSEEIKPSPELGARLPEATPIYLYHGSADDTAPFAHIYLYARAIPYALVHRLEGRNHQLDDDLAEVAADVRALV
jgi:hypothetical protein